MALLFQNALAGTVLILAAALLRCLLKNRLAPEVWLVLWGVCLFRVLTPAAPESDLSLYSLPDLLPERVPSVAEPVPGPTADDGTVPSSPAYPPIGLSSVPPVVLSGGERRIDWGTALGAVWLFGSAVTAVGKAGSWSRTRRAVRGCVPVPDSDPRYAALPKGTRLREGPMAGAPLTFGVLRPTVVLPPGLPGEVLDYVLDHEGVHARRRDNLWHYAVALAQTLYWWDPAVWLMAEPLRRDIELACDRAVLRRLGENRRKGYALTILSLSTKGESTGFSRAFGGKPAEERILAIMNYKKMSAPMIALAAVLVCLVTAAFATVPRSESEEGPAPIVSELNKGERVRAPKSTLPDAVDAVMERFEELVQKMLREQPRAELNPVAQEDCQHIHYVFAPNYNYRTVSSTQHIKLTSMYQVCNDCSAVWQVGPTRETYESHTFGPSSYAGANHSSSNFREHYYIYTKTCPLCAYVETYTRPAACTKDGCVEIASLEEADS